MNTLVSYCKYDIYEILEDVYIVYLRNWIHLIFEVLVYAIIPSKIIEMIDKLIKKLSEPRVTPFV